MSTIKNYEYVVKNPDITLDYKMKNIIAGFPGVGKSTAAKIKDWMFLDMESSDYHWIVDGDGNKERHPEWPINYVDSIIDEARNNMRPQLYILISTHNEVLVELDRRGIYYTAVLPRSKDIYIQRYRERGNSEEFIEKLNANFDTFINSVESTNVFGIYYTDDYLYKIFVPDSYPYSVYENYDSNKDTCYYEFNAQHLPTVHTNRPIVLVADPAMIKNHEHLKITSVDSYFKYLKDNSITVENQSYVDFIKNLANSPIVKSNAIFVKAREFGIIEFCNSKLNFILAVPETYAPNIHTHISSKYGNSKELFDAYISVLKCYSFRTMVSDFYIDEIFDYIPNVDSILLIKTMDAITGITSSEISYDPDKEALPFRNILHDYLSSTEVDCEE